MNYDEHVLGGILTYPMAVLVLSLLKFYGNLPIEMSFIAMALGYAFYVLGSDLPDLDHPEALIHRGSKPIVAVAVGSSIFLKARQYVNITPYEWANLTIAWGIGAIAAFASWYAYTALMPKHRGVVHSLVFAFIYAVSVFVALRYGLGFKFGEALFVGIASFLGYTLHLILDRHIKLL